MSLPETLRDNFETRGAHTHPAAATPLSLPANRYASPLGGGAMSPPPSVIRCVQTGGPNGPITQGRFNGAGILLTGGVWAWSIDGRYVPGRLLDQRREPRRAEVLDSATDIAAHRTEIEITGWDPSRDGWATR